ncbi:hypothetical protein [Actinacidiphila rubida]|uniref:hypothetical protein n=1 Tax=Actinacidiphila rubida TaxID=310780 RepID=UPI00114D24CF|nr:hypothetical protein [Actinacidiphila rubida]
MKSAQRAAVIAGATALAGVLVTGTAQADPTEFRELNGVGSDTTQDVMNGLGKVIVDPNNTPAHLLIASYDAVDPSTGALHDCIVVRKGHACIPRPWGADQGIAALKNDIAGGSGNLDFARSSAGVTDASASSLTWIPFAKEAVTLAVKTGSTLPTNVTTQQLQRAYNCEDETTGAALPAGTFPTINGVTVHPLVPRWFGSGTTRTFWASKLGLSAIDLPGCVKDVAKNGNGIEDGDGSALQRTIAVDGAEDIMPFSIAQWIAQSNSATTGVRDRRNGAVLESVDGTAPTVSGALNTAFPINREVYDVVATSRLAEADIKLAFVGSTSKTCVNTTTLTAYGFGTVADCGSTTLTGKS